MTAQALTVLPPPPSATASGLPPVKKKARKPRRWLRTRDREHLQLLNLQLDINALYSEIQALQVTQSLLKARSLQRADAPSGSYVRMVHEYFAQLRHGYAEQPHMRRARDFLHAMLDVDVAKGHLRGIGLCIQMIAMYTAAFGPVVHELIAANIQLNPDADADTELAHGHRTVLVRAQSRYNTTIVPATFAIVFPNAPRFLQERLMGHALEGFGRFDIVFDTVSRRVVRFDMEFDFLPAFAKVLPRPQDLAMLFSGARVATDCTIGDAAASSAPPLAIEGATTDDDVSSYTSSSDVASPGRSDLPSPGKTSPGRTMALSSILNDMEEEEEST